MTSLLKKLPISIKIGVIKRYGVCLVSFQIVGRIRRQSSCHELRVFTCTADATKQFRRFGIGGVYWASQFITLRPVSLLDIIQSVT